MKVEKQSAEDFGDLRAQRSNEKSNRSRIGLLLGAFGGCTLALGFGTTVNYHGGQIVALALTGTAPFIFLLAGLAFGLRWSLRLFIVVVLLAVVLMTVNRSRFPAIPGHAAVTPPIVTECHNFCPPDLYF
ncbi:MAG TPA: hypothetical protein VEJ63_22465 [Planctomycetota bacterium]|nr:hypothetical protein [Planctomycetota bacterium]